MNTADTKHFEIKLLAEKEKLENELKTVGHINPDNPKDWEPDAGDSANERDTDPNVKGDNMTEFENRTAILKQLETQLLNVNTSLKKIEEGTYGICSVSGEEIEKNRLEANPAAQTCTAHMNEG